MNKQKQTIPSVNYHLWEPCNMRCGFCFATFQDVKNTILPKGHLPKEEAIKVVKILSNYGFEKITFAGGEPTLCPWLEDLIRLAKEAGMITTIVTNGTRLTERFLRENKNYLDWIAISIDSLEEEANRKIGRAIAGKKPITLDAYKNIIDNIRFYGYKMKINTVVNRMNYEEDMSEIIRYGKPIRWKILETLPIIGQNDENIDRFVITNEEFQYFLTLHESLKAVTTIVPESIEQIRGSYAMIDPAGRFFDNTTATYIYSKSILECGVEDALKAVHYSFEKFNERGGIYNWQ